MKKNILLVIIVFILMVMIGVILGPDDNSTTNIEFIVQEFRK